MAKHRRFKPRRWPLAVIGAVLLALIVALVYLNMNAGSTLPPTPPPEQLGQTTQLPQPKSEIPEVEPSRTTQIFLPAASDSLVINAEVFDLDACRQEIKPPLDGPRISGVYGCVDFSQPGTSSPSLTVLAGHSSRLVDTVFNRLYKQGAALKGREVWLKTEASGDKWLVYRIEETYEPLKAELPYMEEIWGSSEIPTAGKLALVTCLQNDDGGGSTKNFIAIARFTGVR